MLLDVVLCQYPMLLGQNFDLLLKLVVVGGKLIFIVDSGVGKTNLLARFDRNQCIPESKPTIGVQFAAKTLKIGNSIVKTQIWDTAGQERFRAITQAYYKGASGALIVFDLTKKLSFDHVPVWLQQFRMYADENVSCILIGNKCDLVDQRVVNQTDIQEFAEKNKISYMQTSAFSAYNVDLAFMTIIQQIYNKIDHQLTNNHSQKNYPKPQKEMKRIYLDKQKSQKKKKKCCK